jgi:hypothetical protein
VLGLATRLPDALVGVLPDIRGALRLRLDDRPQPARKPLGGSRVMPFRLLTVAFAAVFLLPKLEEKVWS